MLVGDMALRWGELVVRRDPGEWEEVSTSSTSKDLFRAVGEEREGENQTDSIKGQWSFVNHGHQTHSAERNFNAKPQHPITM